MAQIFGIAISTSDLIIYSLNLEQSTNVDDDGRIPLKLQGNEPLVDFMTFYFDYKQVFYTYTYFDIKNIFSNIGGLNASIGPIVRAFYPLIILIFLYKLAGIIGESYKDNLRQQLISNIKHL